MKALIIYLSLLFLISSDCLYAQCFVSTFATACTNAISIDGCPTWTDNCGDGWIRSHGTPNIGTYQYERKGQILTGYLAYMWSKSSTDGEGMFTPYLFKKGHSYDVSIQVATSNTNGSIKLYAATGLVQGVLSHCGGAPQNVFKVPIGEFSGPTNGEITLSFVFTNNSPVDLTQIWIYPEGSGVKHELYVKWVQACTSCDGDIIYNNGSVPTGITRVGTISAGSTAGSGGFGTVTVDGSTITNLYATKQINLLPEFHATATGGTFTAKVYECYLLPQGRLETYNFKSIRPLTPPTNDLEKIPGPITESKINVYPSVSTGQVNITGSPQDLENVELTVFDQSGRKMLQIPKANYLDKATINLSHLNNGIYILQIRQQTKTITQKIILTK